jgi:hypothetical protein
MKPSMMNKSIDQARKPSLWPPISTLVVYHIACN